MSSPVEAVGQSKKALAAGQLRKLGAELESSELSSSDSELQDTIEEVLKEGIDGLRE